jgi:formate dehydrogenase subunit delta
MANQIGKYIASQKHTDPATNIADHLAKFWDPGMRAKIVRYAEQGGAGLDPNVMQAVLLLAERSSRASASASAVK